MVEEMARQPQNTNNMPTISLTLAYNINKFLSWFEDTMGEEQWLDTDDNTDEQVPGEGTWKSYLELPEYLDLIKEMKKTKTR